MLTFNMCWLQHSPLLLPLLFFLSRPFCVVPSSVFRGHWSMACLSGRGSVLSDLLWSLCHTDTHIYGNGGLGLRLWSVRLGIRFGDEWQSECVAQGEEGVEEEEMRGQGVRNLQLSPCCSIRQQGDHKGVREGVFVCLLLPYSFLHSPFYKT